MNAQADDLFTFAAQHGAGSGFPGPAAPIFIPPYIAPYLEADGRAFGDDLDAWIEFDQWIHTPAGGEIANRFLRLSVKMKRQGWNAYSAQGIIEGMRWHEHLRHGPKAGDFKVNHNWRRRLAIWAMIRVPELDGFFRVKDRDQAKEEGAEK